MRFLLLLPLFLVGLILNPIDAATLSGKVIDSEDNPLANAQVAIPELNRHATTNTAGEFVFSEIPSGVYAVTANKRGYPSNVATGDLRQKDREITISLGAFSFKGNTVVISGSRAVDELDYAQSVSIVGGKKLDRLRGQSLVETLLDLPSMANYSTGNFVGKPVIRGLASFRSLTMVDGITEEGQQFGDEHGPNLDIFDMQQVQVIRGPGSLLWGSGALGGVMNIITPELPSTAAGYKTLSAKVIGNAFSNNPGGAGGVSLFGATGSVGYRANFSYRQAGDMTTPGGTLPNSQYKNLNGSALVGVTEKWGVLSLRAAHFDMKLNLPGQASDASGNPAFAADPTVTGYQTVTHDRVHARSLLYSDIAKFELNMSYQNNVRQEFDSADALVNSGLHLVLGTFTADLRAHHAPIGPLIGTVGLTYVNQQNQSLGADQLIPEYTSNMYSAFLFEELRFDDFSFTGGVRGDTRRLSPNNNSELGTQAQTLDNTAVTGSLGFVWRFVNGASYFANFSRGFRMPNAFELFSNGQHEGTGTFDVGSANLAPETSWNADTGIKVNKGIFRGEVAAYYNKITNFIYGSPFQQIDNGTQGGVGTGLTSFQTTSPNGLLNNINYTQGNATIYGAEFDGEAQVLKWLALNGGFDLVKGVNDSLGQPLALIPANRLRVGMTLSKNSFIGILNPYFNLKARYVMRKTDYSGPEQQLYSSQNIFGFSDYTIVTTSVGGDFAMGGQLWNFSMGIDNLFNQKYVDYLSRQRLFAYNAGINFYFKLTANLDLIP